MYTYPAPPVKVGSDLTTTEIHHLLKTPTLIQKRVETLADHKFIADYLLKGRYQAQGGAILYESGEEIFPADAPEAVAPGAEYSRTAMTAGELQTARTTKWGKGTDVTDEAVSRLGISPVDNALGKLVNGMVRHVDSVALGVIGSKITQTYSAKAWTSADQIIQDVLMAKAEAEEKNEAASFEYSTVVLKPTQFAKVASYLITSKLLPVEGQNAVLTGVLQDYLGLTWTTSQHTPFSNPVLVDPNQLGGMADETIASPEFTTSGTTGVETSVTRLAENDKYYLRARRVTVPVVLEPAAGVIINGTEI